MVSVLPQRLAVGATQGWVSLRCAALMVETKMRAGVMKRGKRDGWIPSWRQRLGMATGWWEGRRAPVLSCRRLVQAP